MSFSRLFGRGSVIESMVVRKTFVEALKENALVSVKNIVI